MELKMTIEINEGLGSFGDIELYVRDVLEDNLCTNEGDGNIESFKLKVEEIKKEPHN